MFPGGYLVGFLECITKSAEIKRMFENTYGMPVAVFEEGSNPGINNDAIPIVANILPICPPVKLRVFPI